MTEKSQSIIIRTEKSQAIIMTEKFDYTIAPTYKSYNNYNKKHFPYEKTITVEEYNVFRNANCFYCDKSSPNGIDRINKTKGYFDKNCVSCCKQCMLLKSNLTEREFKIWSKRFVKKQNETILSADTKAVFKLTAE